MRFGTLLALITMGLACAQSGAQPQTAETAAAQPAPEVKPAQPAPPPQPPQPPQRRAAGAAGGGSFSDAETRELIRQNAETIGQLRQNTASAASSLKGFDYINQAGWGKSDQPIVITTEPITEEIESEVKEDLTVMDKLLSDAAMGVGGGQAAPHAMGIKLSSSATAEPTYVEELGALFSYRVGIPLSGTAPGGENAKPAAPPSAWENAKREVQSRRGAGGATFIITKKMIGPPPPFDPAKVEELTRAIIKALPEAKNIRHLKESDVVIVTIVGLSDDATNGGSSEGTRMTLKAKKSDIDQAAGGAMTPEAFAERVARRIE